MTHLGLVGLSFGCAAQATTEKDLAVRYQAAERALETKDWDLAASYYHGLWLEEGGSGNSVAGWARALLGAGRPESALAVLLPARERIVSAELASLTGQSLQLMDRPGGAREAFAEALTLDPERFDALEGLGQSLASSGDLAGAAPLLMRAARLRPPASARKAAQAARTTGQDEVELEALVILTEQGLARPGELVRGAQLLAAGRASDPVRASQAEAWLARAVDLDPQAADAWAALGRLRMVRGAESSAVTAFERAIEADPGAVEPLLALAGHYSESGRPERAQRLIDHALGFLTDAEARQPFLELLATLEESPPEPVESSEGGES